MDQEEVELATDILREQVPFLPEDAVVAARLFDLNVGRRGSWTDCMIAATALATRDLADFRELNSWGGAAPSPQGLVYEQLPLPLARISWTAQRHAMGENKLPNGRKPRSPE